ncbi:MAG TPA: hypothetical protein VFI94_12860 [Pseudolabrys sp.]|nr:hypothetical protein [Pseudolabrys sp.]
MTDVSITRKEIGNCFDDLWRGAFESDAAFKDYNWHLKAQSDELSDRSRWRIGVLMYCEG